MRRFAPLLVLVLAGCADDDEPRLAGPDPGQSGRDAGNDAAPLAGDASEGDAAVGEDDAAAPDPDADVADADPDAATPDPDGGPGCPVGTACNPIEIADFPFRETRDTRDAPAAEWDAYACAPDTNESGPELVYRVEVRERGLLSARIEEEPRDDVDIDVHLLGAADPDDCIARDHVGVSAFVEPGTYHIAVDTWVDGDGMAKAGPFTLAVDLRPQGSGACETLPTRLEMFWRSCDPGVPDCVADGGAVYLELPTSGPVVKEAHLVTVADDFGGGWPQSSRDGIERHYALSEAATGFVTERREPWAPEGEGGSQWGQAAYSRPLPVEDEAWYVNMYWRRRPPAGTRMILTNPENGLSVVAAGGYETGPGANTAIAGASEEIHNYLGTRHRSPMVVGFAADPDLPLGPIDCDP
jgi:hypothetical protein